MIHSWYVNDISPRSLLEWVKNTHTQTKKNRKSILFALIYTKDYCHYFTWNNPFVVRFPGWSPPQSTHQVRDRRAFRSVSSEECPDPPKKSWDNPIASMGLVYLHTWIFTSGAEWMIRGAYNTPSLRFKQHPWGDLGIFTYISHKINISYIYISYMDGMVISTRFIWRRWSWFRFRFSSPSQGG